MVYKAINKSAPPRLSGRVNKETFAQHVTGKGSPSLSKDINNFALSSKSGLGLVSEEFSTLELLADGTFEGLGAQWNREWIHQRLYGHLRLGCIGIGGRGWICRVAHCPGWAPGRGGPW